MIEKLSDAARHWHDHLVSSCLFASVGVVIGFGQLLAGSERITVRLLVGRALTTGGLAMAAGVVLVWVPELSLVGQIGVAAGLASLGTSGLERAFLRVIKARR